MKPSSKNEELFLKSAVSCQGSLSREIHRSHTGACYIDNEKYRKLLNGWMMAEEEMSMTEGCRHFRHELQTVQPFATTDKRIVCYRGRTEDHLRNIKIADWEQMGPPEASHIQEPGRYNPIGRPALYLGDSVTGVRFELDAWNQEIFIQEYHLIPSQLRLADFALTNQNPYFDHVFDASESCKVEGRGGRADFVFCHHIASLVKEQGFDGMIVRGVRGENQCYYRNIVIFEPKDRWREWSAQKRGFFKISLPP